MSQTKPYGPKNRYKLTEAHRAQLRPWADRWIANAMSTKPMDAEDKAAMVEAVNGMYDAAGLDRPLNIVFVPSPLVLRLAGGFAAWVWHQRSGGDTRATRAATIAATDDATSAATIAATDDATRAATIAATIAATRDATDDATRDATHAATRDATHAATDDATRDATRAATIDATIAATDDATSAATSAATIAATRAATIDATSAATIAATRAATIDATIAATDDATSAATSAAIDAATIAVTSATTRDARIAASTLTWYRLPVDVWAVAKQFGGAPALRCANLAYRMWNGGNQWSAWVAYLSFFRHVAQLNLLIYDKWKHCEAAAIHGGPRIMHTKFCMISDRPRVLTVDERNRPHNATGPFCEWSDGFALYSWHGVRVPAWTIEKRETITPHHIDAEQNAEIRRAMVEIYDSLRERGAYMRDGGAQMVNRDDWGTLWKKPMPDGRDLFMVEVVNSTPEPDGTFKNYWLRVNHEIRPMQKRGADVEYGEPQKPTALNAVASTFGMTGAEYARSLVAQS